jgi:beta-galactosidase/beta-glucuronidase
MIRRRDFLAAGFGVPALLAQTAPPGTVPEARRAELFEEWKSALGDFSAEAPDFDDSAWAVVRVPDNWEDYQGYRRKSHGNLHGTAWRRRRFTPAAADSARRFFIEFEGVGSYATVWVNSQRLGEHRGGRTGFTFDLTPHLLFGRPNLLAVRAHHPAMIDDRRMFAEAAGARPTPKAPSPSAFFVRCGW